MKIYLVVVISSLFFSSVFAAEEIPSQTHFDRLQLVQDETEILKKILKIEKLAKDQNRQNQYSPWVYGVCENLTRHKYCRSYRQKWKQKALSNELASD